MANKHIDLSEFLSGTPAKQKVPTVKTPSLEPQFIICQQCKGEGKYVVTETHTPELSVEAEEKLEELGKVLPIQQKIVSDPIACKRCGGKGSHYLANDVRAREITLFWTRTKCKCGACYDGPGHQNPCTIKNHVYRPIIIDGKLYGWRFIEVTYTPGVITANLASLPMKIEYFDYSIDACRKCIHEHLVICLPHIKDNVA